MAVKPYWQQRQEMKLKGKKPDSLKRQEAKAKAGFFDAMIARAPKKCMESGKSLAGTMAINPAAVVAHILPKREKNGFPSVALNPLNIVYLEGSVHTDFDNKGKEYILKMKIYQLLCQRVASLLEFLTPEERNRVPKYYLSND